jgi:hypothetical protein
MGIFSLLETVAQSLLVPGQESHIGAKPEPYRDIGRHQPEKSVHGESFFGFFPRWQGRDLWLPVIIITERFLPVHGPESEEARWFF